MDDLISRQAAIDRIQGTGYADAIKNNLMVILRLLPSAQPEIVRCRDCKEYYANDHRCRWWNHGTKEAGWCYVAERMEE